MALLFFWLMSYLQNKHFFVDAVSENIELFSDVSQGSILGPLLFNSYSQKIENIAVSHNIGDRMYVDDIQCCFSFDNSMLLNTLNRKIANFVLNLKT